MSSNTSNLIHFGPYEVTSQVFHQTPLCYCLVNIKPILPGHVLIIPHRHVPRFTDLTPAELTDIFTTVQKVQKMLAKKYFATGAGGGSFNIALQDGIDSGQTVPHVHVHVIPRPQVREGEEELGDGVYELLQGEEGNVGGGLWDEKRRPVHKGGFEGVEEGERRERGKEVMEREAEVYRREMEGVE